VLATTISMDARGTQGNPRDLPKDRQLLAVREVATMLAVSQQTVVRLAARRELRAVRIGSRLLFDPADVEALIEEKKR